VVDADRHVDGANGVTALHELIRKNADWPEHPEVTTPSGGQHDYFAQPDPPLGNGSGSLPPGIDVRGIGGYVIGPGAILPDGTSWQPIQSGCHAPEWPVPPEWLLQLIRGVTHRPTASPHSSLSINRKPSGREERYAMSALIGVAQEISAAPLGKRNTILNAASYRMGRMVGAGWIDRNTVESQLRLAAFALAHDDGAESVLKTIKSGLNAGQGNPCPPLPSRRRARK
jgi:hypothetical protein